MRVSHSVKQFERNCSKRGEPIQTQRPVQRVRSFFFHLPIHFIPIGLHKPCRAKRITRAATRLTSENSANNSRATFFFTLR